MIYMGERIPHDFNQDSQAMVEIPDRKSSEVIRIPE